MLDKYLCLKSQLTNTKLSLINIRNTRASWSSKETVKKYFSNMIW